MEPDRTPVDQWFFHRGLTALVDDTSVKREASLRALPFLLVWFVLVMVAMVPVITGHAFISAAIGLVAILATWVGANRWRGRRLLAPVARFGWPEGVVFTLAPTLTALVAPHTGWRFSDLAISSMESRLGTAAGVTVLQALVLGIALLLVEFGVVSLFLFLGREVVAAILAASGSLARSLPILLGVVTFFFFTGEMWQAVATLTLWPFLGLMALFVALSLSFLSTRSNSRVPELARFETADDLADALVGTPLEGHGHLVASPSRTPLGLQQRLSLRLIATLSRLVVATIVGGSVFVFFVLLGVLTVNGALVEVWTGAPATVVVEVASSVRTYDITLETLRVSGFLAVFSAFYFAVVSATDPALRQGVRDTVEETIRQACACRLVVLAEDAARSAGIREAAS